jgi:hypothetical protein
MIKKKNMFKKTLVIGMLILFIGTSSLQAIAEDYDKNQDTSKLTFYTFDKTGTKKGKAELPNEIAIDISNKFEELKDKIINNPNSEVTKILKDDFVEMLDIYKLIPNEVSKDYVASLLNPQLVISTGKNTPHRAFAHTGTAFICSIAGGGNGLLFSPIMLPRPRITTFWTSVIDARTMAANLLTGFGFIANGPQVGIALGFMGIGISFAFPGEPASFGFGGYALAAFVGADDVDSYPFD